MDESKRDWKLREGAYGYSFFFAATTAATTTTLTTESTIEA